MHKSDVLHSCKVQLKRGSKFLNGACSAALFSVRVGFVLPTSEHCEFPAHPFVFRSTEGGLFTRVVVLFAKSVVARAMYIKYGTSKQGNCA